MLARLTDLNKTAFSFRFITQITFNLRLQIFVLHNKAFTMCRFLMVF